MMLDPQAADRQATPFRADGRIVNAMSVDVEEWFQVGAFENVIDRADWDGFAPRVERNVAEILDLFAEKNVSATFFILGWVAQRHPRLIRRIAEAGHEIASHGWDHARVFTLDAARFADDVRCTRDVLEQAGGTAVTGYRAPSFSIDPRTPWAHAVLAETGHAYSSSVAPIVHDHYGWRDAPRFAFRPLAGSALVELPVTTVEWAGRRFAAGGGGFFRMLPYAVSQAAISRVNAHDGEAAIFYFHPWEIDPDQPRMAHAPLRSRVRHYSRLSAMKAKLARVLDRFAWGRVDALAATALAATEPPRA